MNKINLVKILVFGLSGILLSITIYFGVLIVITVKFLESTQLENHDAAKSSAQILLFLTQWVKKTEKITGDTVFFYPIHLLYNGTQTYLSGIETVALGKDLFLTVVGDKPGRVDENWQDFYISQNTFFSHLLTFEYYLQKNRISWIVKLLGKSPDWERAENVLSKITENKKVWDEVLTYIPVVIGMEGEKKYLILLQNNMEIRPTGGFIGSYIQLTFKHGKLTEREVQDIYVPDGALIGHVEPPYPIQSAFKLGEWRLRDSNWDPDFSQAAKTVQWFFEKGNVSPGDGMIALNLLVIEDILGAVGDIPLPDYGQTITKDTLYLAAQHEAERDFFPGSTQKQNFLSALTNGLFFSMENLTKDQIIKVAEITQTHLEKKNIQIHFNDPVLQSWITKQQWGGQLTRRKNPEVVNDYFSLIEANLGSNKANCCINRQVVSQVVESDENIQVTTQIAFSNESPVERAKPPKYWGGDYKNYVRVLLPQEAKITDVSLDNRPVPGNDISKNVRAEQEIMEIGFFVLVPHLQGTTLSITYVLPKGTQKGYQVSLQKQSGIPSYWYSLEYSSTSGTIQTKHLIDKDIVVRL